MTYQEQSLAIGLLLFLGFIGGILAQKIKVPSITGYVLVGLLLGPSFLNFICPEMIQSLGIIKILGISTIALIVGGELEINKIKVLGKSVLCISTLQVLVAFVTVFLALFFILRLPLPIAVLLGAIATTTAPSAIIAVISELKAKGTMTSTLVGVVAFADTLCIILFGIALAVASTLVADTSGGGPLAALMLPAVELVGSIGLGALSGYLLTHLCYKNVPKTYTLTLLISFAFLNSGVAYLFHLSPLLVNMVTGFVVANTHARPRHIFNVLEEVEFPIFVVFFALAGAALHLQVLIDNWLIVLVYSVFRVAGMAGGAYLGAYLSSKEKNVRRYLGLAIFSKAGIGIGFVLMVQARLPELAALVTAVELSAIVIFQLLGPLGIKYALTAAGEVEVEKRMPAT